MKLSRYTYENRYPTGGYKNINLSGDYTLTIESDCVFELSSDGVYELMLDFQSKKSQHIILMNNGVNKIKLNVEGNTKYVELLPDNFYRIVETDTTTHDFICIEEDELSFIVGPWTGNETKINSGNIPTDGKFGQSVSMSYDGDTCIIGDNYETTGGDRTGAAYIFTRSTGNLWALQQKLQASDKQADDRFGQSVSISADGNTCIVGSLLEDTSAANAGAAYVFTRSGVVWTEQQKLQETNPSASSGFGYSVSISGDGDYCLVGAYFVNEVFYFKRESNSWTEKQKILQSGTVGGGFGDPISISGDGNTCIIGADDNDTTGGTDTGAAYIFTYDDWNDRWYEQQKLIASDAGSGDEFGTSVSISDDGNTCIVGARLEDTSANNAGAAYIFSRSLGVWTEQQKLMASDPEEKDYFGSSVAISPDGNNCIVGSAGVGLAIGAVYIFNKSGSIWTPQPKLQASDKSYWDKFGNAVSMGSDGKTCLIGAYEEGSTATGTGAAYIFKFD